MWFAHQFAKELWKSVKEQTGIMWERRVEGTQVCVAASAVAVSFWCLPGGSSEKTNRQESKKQKQKKRELLTHHKCETNYFANNELVTINFNCNWEERKERAGGERWRGERKWSFGVGIWVCAAKERIKIQIQRSRSYWVGQKCLTTGTLQPLLSQVHPPWHVHEDHLDILLLSAPPCPTSSLNWLIN